MGVGNTGARRGALEDREIPHSRNFTRTPGEKDFDLRGSKSTSQALGCLVKEPLLRA